MNSPTTPQSTPPPDPSPQTRAARRPRPNSRIGALWHCLLLLLASFLSPALFAAPPVAVLPPAGTAPVNPPAGGFGIDGNLLANVPTPVGIGDWVKLVGDPGGGGGVLDPVTGDPLNPATTFHLRDLYNSSADVIFTSTGDKFNDSPATWNLGAQSAPDKNDIENALIHFTSDSLGNTWVIVSGDRLSNKGESYIDFEFFQKSVTLDSTTLKLSSGGNQGGRTVNDFCLSFSFIGGGSNPEFTAWQWKSSGTGYDYFDSTANIISPIGRVFGAVNSGDVSVPYGAFGGLTTYKANQFAEVAVNLTAVVESFNPCRSLGIKTILI